jgi:hypothetical protein
VPRLFRESVSPKLTARTSRFLPSPFTLEAFYARTFLAASRHAAETNRHTREKSLRRCAIPDSRIGAECPEGSELFDRFADETYHRLPAAGKLCAGEILGHVALHFAAVPGRDEAIAFLKNWS